MKPFADEITSMKAKESNEKLDGNSQVRVWETYFKIHRMKKLLFLLVSFFAICLSSCHQTQPLDLSSIDPGRYDSTWYNRAPFRHIQTNLREIDADMDVDVYVKALLDASANVVTFNTGGIRAFYPTKLPFHYKSPYLHGDLVGEVIKKFHENGIKFIARFDMSKVHETIAEAHPEWLYVGTDGKVVNYNGEVHTCINGGYQQEYAFRILEEAISTYPFDGVFFNNAGFTTTDYSQVYHGICQCDNCKKRFRDSTGLTLPVAANMSDPVYRKYRVWQQSIIAGYTRRVKKFFEMLDPGLVYFNREGDVFRSESGTSFTSADYWTYHGTENVKMVLGSNRDQMPSDTYNYLLGMDYRLTATSPNIGRIFLAEHMLNGAGPAVYFIGRIENQSDRVFIPELETIFRFHKTYEKLFTNVESRAKIGLVMGAPEEYRGIMRLLTEQHIMYDLIQEEALGSDRLPRQLDAYDVIILGNVTGMSHQTMALIDNYVKSGGKVIVTGFPGFSGGTDPGDQTEDIRLRCLGILPEYQVFPRTRSTYLSIEENDKSALGQEELRDFDVIMMNSEFLKCKPGPTARGYMKLVPNTMHGPPEKCYFTDADITGYPGLVVNEFGRGKSVFFPWLIGSQYNWRGNNAHRALFFATLQNLLNYENPLITNSSPLIEITHLVNRNEAFEWIGMINHSGQIGDVFREPVPVYNSKVSFRPMKSVKSVYLVRSGKNLKFKQKEGKLECIVPEVNDFEMVLCLYK